MVEERRGWGNSTKRLKGNDVGCEHVGDIAIRWTSLNGGWNLRPPLFSVATKFKQKWHTNFNKTRYSKQPSRK